MRSFLLTSVHNLSQWLRKCCLKIFLFLALVAILFRGAELTVCTIFLLFKSTNLSSHVPNWFLFPLALRDTGTLYTTWHVTLLLINRGHLMSFRGIFL